MMFKMDNNGFTLKRDDLEFQKKKMWVGHAQIHAQQPEDRATTDGFRMVSPTDFF